MPGLGTTKSKFQLSAGWRYTNANASYFDGHVNHDFTNLWKPKERLSVLDVTAGYTVNSRLSVQATLPIVFNRFSQLFPPQGSPLDRRVGWAATDIGDMSLFGQYALLNPKKHPFENISLGLGMKIPTGSWNLRANIPDEVGLNTTRRAMYPAIIQPGDGGTGVLVGYNAWKIFRRPDLLRNVTVYSSAVYLINPRDTNGTPSIIKELGVPLTPNFLDRLTNSVTDSWTMQVGAATKIPGTWNKPKLKGLRFTTGLHWEGVARRDLIGGNHGFRQPGYTMSVAPGVVYAHGRDQLMLEVPIVFWRHIDPARSLLPGLPRITPAGLAPGALNFNRQMGLVAPVAVSLRYVRAF